MSHSPTQPALSVVLPAYNEAERGLEQRLLDTLRYLARAFPEHEVIVVDDGSSDSTSDLVRELSSRYSQLRLVTLPKNKGKGAAVQMGMAHSRGDRVLFMDADLATPLDELSRLMGRLDEGYDVAIASRGLPESVLERRENPLRESCGKIYNRLVQALVLPGVMDTQCGCKAFRGVLARSLAPALTEQRFGFDVELLYLAHASGAAIHEMPVRWTHQPGSRLRFLNDGWSMMLALLRIAWRKRTGGYRPMVAGIRSRVHELERESADTNRPEPPPDTKASAS